MEASSSRNRSQGTTLQSSFSRSISPSGRFCSSSISTSSSNSYVSTPSEAFLTRPTSPTRINVYRSVSPSAIVRFSTSHNHSIASSRNRYASPSTRTRKFNPGPKKTCMCSPTTHPGSFRCSLHKNTRSHGYNSNSQSTSFRSSHHLNMRRSAMTNSLYKFQFCGRSASGVYALHPWKAMVHLGAWRRTEPIMDLYAKGGKKDSKINTSNNAIKA